MLAFYPADVTFVCPTELRAFAELHDEFCAVGARIVAAKTDGAATTGWSRLRSTTLGCGHH